MTVTGIVAEFNPFHNGHKYLLQEIDGLKIVAMSGNFLQRGEPALIDKWTRAQVALQNGADLIVELPFLVSVQSADYFAKGAVDILTRLGIERLAFGSEELLDYQNIASIYQEKEEEMARFLANLSDELSYPQKTQKMWEHFTGIKFSGQTPNHILALAYAKASADKNIKLLPIKRQGAGFHSQSKEEGLASATAIRKHILDQEFVAKVTPCSNLLLAAPQVSWDDYFQFLRYQILSHPDLSSIFQVNDELASRICAVIGRVATLEELVEEVSTKRYTRARVCRVLTYILVSVVESPLPEAIHVLGFSEKGQAHLKSLRKSVHLITRIGSEPWDSLTQKADQIYQLGNLQLAEQNWGRVPVRLA
ncbi:nucleotidyltransferase [Streptococcus didelphis]|uniref:tRNA(Met) cytidine acetate ligase n=1 Tax=Streptococcus didelphis TaxID=102886 RepID=A0ABY9LIG7_9STRE|nr:nucleotidyltransferase [Streptococcus didelphis]WMB28585.1 nucleotidyltransferase [Streptococcus didelphis]WMB29259.1 nucleotidyltransferase [Streptococcus didelphis]